MGVALVTHEELCMTSAQKLFLSPIAALVLAAAVTGCGKEEFVDQKYSTSVSAAGYQTVAAKVDLLIVTDNTGSFSFPYGEFQAYMPTFVNALASQGWNYHIASIAMAPVSTSDGRVNRVLVSHNDQYLPYTGVTNPDYVPAAYAVTNPSQVNFSFSTNTTVGSSERTFQVVRDALSQSRSSGVNFIREDAQLAIIVISNGDDNSGNDATYWASQIAAGAGKDLRSIKLFPVVAQQLRLDRSCWSSNANRGARYLQMASNLGVAAPWMFDVCTSSSLGTLVQTLASQITASKVPFVRDAVIVRDRCLTNVTIKKNGAVIPNMATPPTDPSVSAWVSEGYSTSQVCAISSPYPEMCEPRGCVYRLYGPAKASGSDTLSIEGT